MVREIRLISMKSFDLLLKVGRQQSYHARLCLRGLDDIYPDLFEIGVHLLKHRNAPFDMDECVEGLTFVSLPSSK